MRKDKERERARESEEKNELTLKWVLYRLKNSCNQSHWRGANQTQNAYETYELHTHIEITIRKH